MARKKVQIEREKIIKNIQDRVDELSFPQLSQQSNQQKDFIIKEIETVLEQYLIKYQNKAMIIDARTKDLNLQDVDSENKNKNLYIAYKILLDLDMTNLLRDGYILIENLRKTFTDQEIEYETAISYSFGSGAENRQVINRKISLAELLSYAKAEIQQGGQGLSGFKLRASASQADFNVDFNKYKNIADSYTENYHSLYPKVRRVLLQKGYSNEGNFYETYQQLKYSGQADHSPNKKDPKKIKGSTIIDKYMEVRRGTQSFVSGGDFEMTQFKLLSGSGASIASLLTIGQALKLILYYIKESKSANITVENIKKNVFSKEFDQMIKNGLSNLITQIEQEISDIIPSNI